MAINHQKCRENFRQQIAHQWEAREMLRSQARTKAIAAILQSVAGYAEITQVYLFGSITQPGQFHHHSDIDIAVAGTDAVTYFAFWRDLEVAYPNQAIDLREINQPCHFTDIVRQTGDLIYASTGGSAQGEH
ncbi:MAG: nucleotidyltransferase domain-containing protein [Cyanobacteria bacterium P01_F01_bin.56]